MRYSKMIGKSQHDPPCDADSINAKFLTQGGFVDKVAAGIYNYLPLGLRVLHKIHQIIREEMDAIDGQEIMMPCLHPIDLWKTTGRDKTMDDVLYRSNSTGGKEFVLGPSHEETVTPLVGKFIQSYKDLPYSAYQIQTKFRDEPRAKSGLLRGREFGMKDMYSFHETEEDLDNYYERSIQAYFNVFERCGLKTHIIEASGGAFSDKLSHEFSVETPAGEDKILICDQCEIAQNLEIAEGKVKDPEDEEEKELEMKEVEVERGFTVKDNATAHDVPEHKILKSVVYEVEDEGLVGIVIRGDLNVNENKLENYFKKHLRPASSDLLKKAGLVKGFISPVNMPEEVGISFIADHSIKGVKNYVTGANKTNVDLVNVNVGRDFTVKDFTDLVEVESGFHCTKCSEPLKEITAIESGNIFKLGTKYSDAFGLKYTDKDGSQKPFVMGCYGIGTSRLVGTIVEAHHDDNGIIWPSTVAPYLVHLMNLGDDEEVMHQAELIYKDLSASGIEVLFDDRDERAGVKFKDSDLIGNPVRLVVSKKTLCEDSVEWKLRASENAELVKISDLKSKLQELL